MSHEEMHPKMHQNMGKGDKFHKVMHEFGLGRLKSSSGEKVSDPEQAKAIAASEAGMKKKRKK